MDKRARGNKSVAISIAIAIVLGGLSVAAGATAAVALDDPPVASDLSALAEGAVVLSSAVAPDDRLVVAGRLGHDKDAVFDPHGAAVAFPRSDTDGNGFIASFSPTGELQWVRRLPSPSFSLTFARPSIAVGADGDAVVTDRLSFATTLEPGVPIAPVGPHDHFVIRFDAAGAVEWARTIESSADDSGTSSDIPSVAFDSTNGVFVSTRFLATVAIDDGTTTLDQTSAGSWDSLVASFSSTGQIRWLGRIGGAGADSPSRLIASPSDGVRASQFVSSPPETASSTASSPAVQQTQAGLAMFDFAAGGAPLATSRWASTSASGHVDVWDVAPAAGGDVLIAGSRVGTTTIGSQPPTVALPAANTSGHGFVARFGPSGEARWATPLHARGQGSAITDVVASGDDIFVTGWSESSPKKGAVDGDLDLGDAGGSTLGDSTVPATIVNPSLEDPGGQLVARLDGDAGTPAWMTSGADDDVAHTPLQVDVRSSGSVVVTGRTRESAFTLGREPGSRTVQFAPGNRYSAWAAELPPDGLPQGLPACTRLATVSSTGALDVRSGQGPARAPITTPTPPTGPLAWYRDASRLVYIAPDGVGQHAVHIVGADGMPAATAIAVIASATAPAVQHLQFSPSGDWVGWEYPVGTVNLAPADGSALPVTRAVGPNRGGDPFGFASDDRVAWAATDGVRVAEPGGVGEQLVSAGAPTAVMWHPNNTTIYYSTSSGLAGVAADGSASAVPLPTGDTAEVEEAFLSSAGDAIYFTARKSSTSTPDEPDNRVWSVATSGGSPPTALNGGPTNVGSVWRYDPQLSRGGTNTLVYYLASYITDFFGGRQGIEVNAGTIDTRNGSVREILRDSAVRTFSPFGQPPPPPPLGELPKVWSPTGDSYVSSDLLFSSFDQAATLDLEPSGAAPLRGAAFAQVTPDLGIALQLPSGPASRGDRLAGKVTVDNHSGCAASSVAVPFELDGPATIVAAQPSKGTFANDRWDVGALAPNETATIDVTIEIGTVPVGAGVGSLAVEVETPSGDHHPDDDAATVEFGLRDAPQFHVVAPTRLVDTRNGTGVPAAGPVVPGGPLAVDVTGVSPLPADGIGGVWLNLTAVFPSVDTHLTAWPGGTSMPQTSNLNLPAGDVRATSVLVAPGPDGTVNVANNSGATHVVVDVFGWVDVGAVGVPGAPEGPGAAPSAPAAIPEPRSGVTPLPPSRVLDTRDGTGVSHPAALTSAGPLTLDVTGVGGVPAQGVSGVILNVTGVFSDQATHLTAWAGDQTKPLVSNLNLPPGEMRPNLTVVPVGADGTIKIATNSGTIHVVADVLGWVSSLPNTEVALDPQAPTRLLDTRNGAGLPGGTPDRLGPGEKVTIDLTGKVPDATRAVVVNLTGTGPSQPTHLTAYPGGQTAPLASNLNLDTGQTAANLAVVVLGDGDEIEIRNNSGQVDLVVDLFGYL